MPKDTTIGSKRAKDLIGQWIKITNKHLSKIGKLCNIEADITTYVARHSWAATAKRLGFSNEMIVKGLGHEHGNKITNIYLDDFDQTLIDQMNDKIIILVIPCLKQIKSSLKFTCEHLLTLSK